MQCVLCRSNDGSQPDTVVKFKFKFFFSAYGCVDGCMHQPGEERRREREIDRASMSMNEHGLERRFRTFNYRLLLIENYALQDCLIE